MRGKSRNSFKASAIFGDAVINAVLAAFSASLLPVDALQSATPLPIGQVTRKGMADVLAQALFKGKKD